jgi:hypothetical protein
MVFPMKLASSRSDWIIAGWFIHACLVTVLWLLVFKFEVDVFSAKIWMVFALTWLLWPLCAFISPRVTWKKWIATAVVGIVVLAPTIPTLYTFIVWTAEGFAP